jgi:hypothetical protein
MAVVQAAGRHFARLKQSLAMLAVNFALILAKLPRRIARDYLRAN